jgi:predicted dehydrogenase
MALDHGVGEDVLSKKARQWEMRRLNWAIMGCGRISDIRVAPGLKSSRINKPAAIVSRDSVRAAEFATKHGADSHYISLDSALADPTIDVVYVGTPNALHAKPTIASCRAGKHVFCDKPMALSIEDCVAMICAAKECGAKLGIGFNNRYNPAHQEIFGA